MDSLLRFGIFACVFAVMALAELLWPRRYQSTPRRVRWLSNIAMTIIDIVMVRVMMPLSLVVWAVMVAHHGWGAMNIVSAPLWLSVPVAIILLDLVVYGQHVMFHHVPFLWRLHRVHHTDTELDVTTALRFHPLEILISMGIKFLAILVLGVPAEAVVAFEIILNACAMFNHGNVNVPSKIDAALRKVMVTPDMHRVHHSVRVEETNSNYGFNIALWDRLFGTYRAQPVDGHDGMTIGLEQFRGAHESRLDKLLAQPFRKGS